MGQRMLAQNPKIAGACQTRAFSSQQHMQKTAECMLSERLNVHGVASGMLTKINAPRRSRWAPGPLNQRALGTSVTLQMAMEREKPRCKHAGLLRNCMLPICLPLHKGPELSGTRSGRLSSASREDPWPQQPAWHVGGSPCCSFKGQMCTQPKGRCTGWTQTRTCSSYRISHLVIAKDSVSQHGSCTLGSHTCIWVPSLGHQIQISTFFYLSSHPSMLTEFMTSPGKPLVKFSSQRWLEGLPQSVSPQPPALLAP